MLPGYPAAGGQPPARPGPTRTASEMPRGAIASQPAASAATDRASRAMHRLSLQ